MRIKNAIVFFICLTIIFVSASAATIIILTKKDSQKRSNTDKCDFLIEADWSCYDSELDEMLNITFYENGDYIFSCDCGEPVGDSDLYDTFNYNHENKTIYLSGPDQETSEIKVIYYDKHFLVLKTEEKGTLVFRNQDSPASEELLGDAEQHINKDEMAFVSFLEYDEDKLTVAPHYYDRDAHESFKEYICDIEISDDFSCKLVTVTVNKGVSKTEVEALNVSDYEYIGEYYTGGYVTFDKDGKASKIVFYGSIEIQ